MVNLNDLWMRPFEDLGPCRDEDGHLVRGSDPELLREDGQWYLFHTFGPAVPGAPGGTYPGIYCNRGKDLQSGYSRPRLIFRPTGGHASAGVETFSADYVPAMSGWIGMCHVYAAGKTDSRLRAIYTRTLAELFEAHDPIDLEPDHHGLPAQYDWEAQRVSEAGVCWSRSFNALAVTYSGMSEPPAQRWSTAMMASPDGGLHWHKPMTPFAVPPRTFEEGQGINAYSHSTLAEDPRHPRVLHCITTASGNVSADQKGLVQWVFHEGLWHRAPHLLVNSADLGVNHVGGPSLRWDVEGERWMMAAHADGGPQGLPRHSRILVENDS